MTLSLKLHKTFADLVDEAVELLVTKYPSVAYAHEVDVVWSLEPVVAKTFTPGIPGRGYKSKGVVYA